MSMKTILCALAANAGFVTLAARSHVKMQKVEAVTNLMDKVGSLLQMHDYSLNGVVHTRVMDNLRSLAVATPGATDSLNEVLTEVIHEIERDVESKIKGGHADTQAAIDKSIDDLSAKTSLALSQKVDANDHDSTWFTCVAAEKAQMETHEAAVEALEKAKESIVIPCQQQEERKMFAWAPTPNSLKFACDFGAEGDCDKQSENYQIQVKSMLADLNSDTKQATDSYTEAKTACDAANADVVAKDSARHHEIFAWNRKREECIGKHEERLLSMCLFGSSLQHKCAQVVAHTNILEEVDQVNGGQFSHPDRVQEWRTTQITKCMLSKVISAASIDAAALDACEQTVNFAGDVGEIDSKQMAFAELTTPGKFTCEETTITFGGETWEVPHSGFPKAADYITAPFHPKVGMEAGSAPFNFCGKHNEDVLHWVASCQQCNIEWCQNIENRVDVAGIDSSTYDLGTWLSTEGCEWLDQLPKPVQQLRDSTNGGIFVIERRQT